MIKVVHNTDTGFAQEAKASGSPVRVGVKVEPSRGENVDFLYYYLTATAVVGEELHEYKMLFEVVPAPFIDREKPKVFEKFKEVAEKFKEWLESEGIEKVKVGSFYALEEEKSC